jgi:hypothetical protein
MDEHIASILRAQVTFLRNVGNHLQDHTATESSGPQLTYLPLWEPQTSDRSCTTETVFCGTGLPSCVNEVYGLWLPCWIGLIALNGCFIFKISHLVCGLSVLCNRLPWFYIFHVYSQFLVTLWQFEPVTVAVRSEAWVLAGRLLGSWVRFPLKAWLFVRVFLCCVVLCR